MDLSGLSLGELRDEAHSAALNIKNDYDEWNGRDIDTAMVIADSAANLADIILEIGKREGKS